MVRNNSECLALSSKTNLQEYQCYNRRGWQAVDANTIEQHVINKQLTHFLSCVRAGLKISLCMWIIQAVFLAIMSATHPDISFLVQVHVEISSPIQIVFS